MNYKEIIADSWQFTQENKSLIFWFGFIPSILTTSFSIIYVIYQFFAFRSSPLFGVEDSDFFAEVGAFIWEFFSENVSLTVPMVVTVAILIFMYIFFPTLAKAAAIQKIARTINGQKVSIPLALRYGFMPFLILFQYHLITRTFAFLPLLFQMGIIARNFGPSLLQFLFPIYALIMIIGLVLTIFFTYADFYIVIDREGVFNAIKKSVSLVGTHLKHTFLVSVLMIIIGVRVVIQAILVFLLPAIIISVTGYIASVALPVTGVIVGGIVGLIVLLVSAYLNGVVDIFSYTVWTLTFLRLSEEKVPSAREVIENSD